MEIVEIVKQLVILIVNSHIELILILYRDVFLFSACLIMVIETMVDARANVV
jgi:hypothetical protein